LILVSATVVEGTDSEFDREVSLSEGLSSVHVSSESKNFNTNDRFDFTFDHGTLKLWYTLDTKSTGTVAWELQIVLEQVFSFIDDGNGRFDVNDTIVSSLDISDLAFSLNYSTVQIPHGGKKTTVNILAEQGILTFVFAITTSPIVVADTTMSPNDVEFDVKINGYEYEEGDFIGLRFMVRSDSESILYYDELDNAAELYLSHRPMSGTFRWPNTANVDGIGKPVSSTWTDENLTLSYPAGTSIIHDTILIIHSLAPLSGLAVPAGVVGSPMLYGLGLTLAVATVIGAVIARRRRQTQSEM
jgi:hypothetical protein